MLSSVGGLVMLFSGLVLLFDVVSALISVRTGLNYGYFAIGAFALYGVCGYLIGGLAGAAMAGSGTGTVATVDATLGWALSWRIGPGRLPEGIRTPRRIVRGATFTILAASGVGLLFGLIGSSFGTS